MTEPNAGPRFLTPGEMLDLLVPWCVLGPEGSREALAPVLARVPQPECLEVVCGTLFAVAGAARAEHLPPGLLAGRELVVLGPGVLDLPEDMRAGLVLPAVARSVLGARHPRQQPESPGAELLDLFDAEAGRWDVPRVREVLRRDRDARADLQIDAHFDGRRADDLARRWLTEWEKAREVGRI